jgi:hypothetical protein
VVRDDGAELHRRSMAWSARRARCRLTAHQWPESPGSR